jgi:hypothetical protein
MTKDDSNIQKDMTNKNTYYLAAEMISETDFPNRNKVPNLYPPVFNNFGHQSLFNYNLFFDIIWETINKIKSSVLIEKNNSIRFLIKIAFVIDILLTIFCSCLGLNIIAIFQVIVYSTIFICGISINKINKDAIKKIAKIRADTIDCLINSTWSSNPVIQNQIIKIGDGKIGGEKIPVIIVYNKQNSFPGYGKVQSENFFICRPKEKNSLIWDSTVFFTDEIKEDFFEKVKKDETHDLILQYINSKLYENEKYKDLELHNENFIEFINLLILPDKNFCSQIKNLNEIIKNNSQIKELYEKLDKNKIDIQRLNYLLLVELYPQYISKSNSCPTIDEIYKYVTDKITDKIKSIGINDLSIGNIIAIEAQSIQLDSNWLDYEKTPILWLNKSELKSVKSKDPRAHTRTYFVVQVLFPQYMTTATYFVRLFWASNSISCQISVATLGPPKIEKKHLLKRLLDHKTELKKNNYIQSLINNWTELISNTISRNYEEKKILNELKSISNQLNNSFISDPIKIRNIKRIKLENMIKAPSNYYNKKFKELISKCTAWPAIYSEIWRDKKSNMFNTDFFGMPESIASVMTIYDQLSRTILDSFNFLGFDISDYHDKEGRYFINANKIENISVGGELYNFNQNEGQINVAKGNAKIEAKTQNNTTKK